MSDIEQALAEAFHALSSWPSHPPDECDECDYYRALSAQPDRAAEFILATEPMQAIARQAAIGAAVERAATEGKWSGNLRLHVYRGTYIPQEFEWYARLGSIFDEWRPAHGADTLPEAIAAALDPEAPTDE